MAETQGYRIPDPDGYVFLKEGEYGKFGDIWYGRPPGLYMGNFSEHKVTVHDDGTITVSPSILIDEGDKQWHGYLEKGVWRDA